jgi:hypothetical protein
MPTVPVLATGKVPKPHYHSLLTLHLCISIGGKLRGLRPGKRQRLVRIAIYRQHPMERAAHPEFSYRRWHLESVTGASQEEPRGQRYSLKPQPLVARSGRDRRRDRHRLFHGDLVWLSLSRQARSCLARSTTCRYRYSYWDTCDRASYRNVLRFGDRLSSPFAPGESPTPEGRARQLLSEMVTLAESVWSAAPSYSYDLC